MSDSKNTPRNHGRSKTKTSMISSLNEIGENL